MPKPKPGQTQTYLIFPEWLREALETARKRDKRTLTATIEIACEEWLRRQHPDLLPPEPKGG